MNTSIPQLADLPRSCVHLVGGAVRDSLMGKDPKDLDFVIVGMSPDDVFTSLSRCGHVEEIESRNFGVFKFTPQGQTEIIDVALPRRDRWTGLTYTDMIPEIGVSLEEDLGRRDFTINAMAQSLDGDLVDPFGGQKDLQSRLIRAVGDPRQRFDEDPSRILRGLRLACQLDFEIEEETFRTMREMASEVVRLTEDGETRVSAEVVGTEFLRGFATNPVRLISLWDEVGLLDLLLPELSALKGVPQPEEYHSEGDVWIHTMLALGNLRGGDGPIPLRPDAIHAKLAVLLHDVGKPSVLQMPEETGDRIRFSNHDKIGGKMVGEIVDRMRLSVFPHDHPLHVERERLAFLVGYHMLRLDRGCNVKLSTLEKHFFSPEERGGELLAVMQADLSAALRADGKPDLGCHSALLEKLGLVANSLRFRVKERGLPHLLNGLEIMEIAGIPPGPEVGRIKDALRDLHLAGELTTAEEAREWLVRR